MWNSLDSSRIGEGLKAVNRTHPLVLKTLVALPKAKVLLSFTASVPFDLDLGGESVKSMRSGSGRAQTAEATAEVESDVIDLGLTLRLDESTPFTLAATYRTSTDPTDRPLTPDRLVLPWAPPPAPSASPTPVPDGLPLGGRPGEGGRPVQGGSGQVRDLPPGPR